MKNNREQEITQLVQSLDITPTMRKQAKEKYDAIATYLQSHGIDCNIYPQGSFALGTVVKPLSKDSYDLDTICELFTDKQETTAKETKESVGHVLKTSVRYCDIQEYDTCWTKEYAEGFNIDLVPAVNEDLEKKRILKSKSTTNPNLADLSIAITKGTAPQYRWTTSNPKGYAAWFKGVNKPFLDNNRLQRRQSIFEHNRTVYSSVESIPEEDERSALQIAVQILKRHRDEYFSKLKEDEKDDAPNSAVITTLVASIAQKHPAYLNPLEILGRVANELKTYAQLAAMDQIRFTQKYSALNLIQRKNGEWFLPNPANPEDNLLDSWNDTSNNRNRANSFFKWVNVVVNDFLAFESAEDMRYLAVVKTAFGKQLVEQCSAFAHYNESVSQPYTPVITSAKPWKGNENALHQHR